MSLPSFFDSAVFHIPGIKVLRQWARLFPQLFMHYIYHIGLYKVAENTKAIHQWLKTLSACLLNIWERSFGGEV